MTLDELKFIRFAMHILSKGFVRHYGVVSSTSKLACAAVTKEQLSPIAESNSVKWPQTP
jgi:hypothetical protein